MRLLLKSMTNWTSEQWSFSAASFRLVRQFVGWVEQRDL
jgi:hypothetical protein